MSVCYQLSRTWYFVLKNLRGRVPVTPWLWAVILYFLYFYDIWSMNYIWRRKLCYCHQALDVLNYEHVILYIHMYEPYSCAIKFMLFIIRQLLIIAYIIIYIYRFKLFVTGSICSVQNNWTSGSISSKWLDQWTDGLTGSISDPVPITMLPARHVTPWIRLYLNVETGTHKHKYIRTSPREGHLTGHNLKPCMYATQSNLFHFLR